MIQGINMKVYFAASVRGKANFEEQYNKIVEVLQKGRCQVYADHILNNNSDKVEHQSHEEVQKAYKVLSEQMKKADLVVAEVSTPSVSVGHEISESLTMGKPVIMLHVEGGNRAMLLEGRRDERIQTIDYNIENLEKKLLEALDEASKLMDVRFNFFVSPKILRYLDWVSQNRKVPRSVFLRDLIEKEMRKDKEYKEDL
ncbi:MAG TPA: nucleoside 2-deoxyribosyltransferase [Patescibacteria group bacterium]